MHNEERLVRALLHRPAYVDTRAVASDNLKKMYICTRNMTWKAHPAHTVIFHEHISPKKHRAP